MMGGYLNNKTTMSYVIYVINGEWWKLIGLKNMNLKSGWKVTHISTCTDAKPSKSQSSLFKSPKSMLIECWNLQGIHLIMKFDFHKILTNW